MIVEHIIIIVYIIHVQRFDLPCTTILDLIFEMRPVNPNMRKA